MDIQRLYSRSDQSQKKKNKKKNTKLEDLYHQMSGVWTAQQSKGAEHGAQKELAGSWHILSADLEQRRATIQCGKEGLFSK